MNSLEELDHAYTTASYEAKSNFSDPALYMEKLLTDVKHIEVQVLADSKGNVVCFAERDCSMQRKHQKILEESPCALISPQQRARLIRFARQAVRAIAYEGVGTLEFLMDQEGNFYFMEMNTRLQVEHPVTELVSGIDLVKWQIRTAAGIALPFRQKDIETRGMP